MFNYLHLVRHQKLKTMAETKKRRVRGISTLRIIHHRKVHEIYHRLVKEAGDFAKKLPKSHFTEIIANETGYSPTTVNQILNKKEISE